MSRRAARPQWSESGSLRGAGTGWLIVLAGLVIAQGFSALAQIVLARRVGSEDYGRYLASIGLATVLVAFVSLGLDQWLLASSSTSPQATSKRFYSALRLRLPLIAIWLLALGALTRALPSLTFPPPYITLAGAAIAGESTALLAYAGLRNRGLHGRVTLTQSAGTALVLLGAAALPLEPGRAGWFLAARALAGAGVAIASVFLMRLAVGRSTEGMAPVKEVAASALPFMTSELAVAVYMRADLTILSLTKGVAGASVYGPATSLLSMCFLAPTALYLLALPPMARKFPNSRERYERLSLAQLAAQGASGLALFAGVFALAPWLISVVLGPGYEASAGTLRLLSPILLFKSLSFGFGAILTSQGRQGARTQVQIGVAVVNLLANLLVVGRFGIVGVAVVYVLSEMALLGGYAVAAARGGGEPQEPTEAGRDEDPDH